MKPSDRARARRAAQRVELDAAAETVRRRSRGRCELRTPVCTTWATDSPHHRRLRSQGGAHTAENLADTCASCHRYAHDHPAEAYAAGWMIATTA